MLNTPRRVAKFSFAGGPTHLSSCGDPSYIPHFPPSRPYPLEQEVQRLEDHDHRREDFARAFLAMQDTSFGPVVREVRIEVHGELFEHVEVDAEEGRLERLGRGVQSQKERWRRSDRHGADADSIDTRRLLLALGGAPSGVWLR